MSTADEVKALLEKATPERWWLVPEQHGLIGGASNGVARITLADCPEADAALIAAAPDLARAYIRLAEAAQEVVAAGSSHDQQWMIDAYDKLVTALSLPLRSEEEGT